MSTLPFEPFETRLAGVLRKIFPGGLYKITPERDGRARIKVVWPGWRGIGDAERNDSAWRKLRNEIGEDLNDVSVLLCYDPDEPWRD